MRVLLGVTASLLLLALVVVGIRSTDDGPTAVVLDNPSPTGVARTMGEDAVPLSCDEAAQLIADAVVDIVAAIDMDAVLRGEGIPEELSGDLEVTVDDAGARADCDDRELRQTAAELLVPTAAEQLSPDELSRRQTVLSGFLIGLLPEAFTEPPQYPTIPQTTTAPTTTAAAEQDGALDCVDGERWDATAETAEDAVGESTPDAAVTRRLLEYALAGDLRIDGGVGTAVVDGREVVRATAREVTGGTWLSTFQEGCSADSQPEGRVGALVGPCPTTGMEAASAADVLVLQGTEFGVIGPVEGGLVGTELLRTGCRLQDGTWPDGYRRSGEAGQLPPGTPIHSIDGLSQDVAVVALTPGGAVRYDAIGPIPLPPVGR